MASVSIRDLRNRSRAVIEQIAGGETLTVTRDGTPVAEIRPLARAPLSAETLLSRWQRLPTLDSGLLRAEIDSVLDSSV